MNTKNIKKVLIIVVNYLINYHFFFTIVGFVNKKLLKGRIKSVFLVYPAKQKHITDYTFDWFNKKMKWQPFIIGFFIQKKQFGITFTISSEEKEFFDDKNNDNLELLVEKMEKIRVILGAEIKSFAGVLPGILSKKNILKEINKENPTAIAIFRALETLEDKEGLKSNFPLIVLGGKGFIGRKFISLFKEKKGSGERIFSVDIDNFLEMPKILEKTSGESVVFLNITKNKALSEYIKFFNAKTVVLNEVYPEPSDEELTRIKQKGAECYHIVGLKGRVYPPFPGAYSKGVPCCASFVSCGKNDIIIKKLT